MFILFQIKKFLTILVNNNNPAMVISITELQ